jgi:hypothetical protein
MITHHTDSAAYLVEMLHLLAPEYDQMILPLSIDAFERAFETYLFSKVEELERSARRFENLDEEALSSIFAGFINMPGISAVCEAYSNGHVDIVIEVGFTNPKKRKLAEAKVYDGPTYHIDGVRQLISRYITGRETRGLMLVYVKKPNIQALIKKIQQEMDKRKPYKQQGLTTKLDRDWCFSSTHIHHSGKQVQVTHICCNLYVEPIKSKK